MKKFLVVIGVLLLLASLTSCQKPFDKPEFIDIGTNETAFVVPLTGATSDQKAFMSIEYLEKNMVATKRIQISHEWVQTGRRSTEGQYLPSIKVIKVDRTPVSATWTSTSGNQKVGVESIESIGFTVGLSVTAMIEATDAPPLKDIVNTDVNAYIKSRCSAYFGVLTIEDAKKQKQEILDKVLKETRAFFLPFGVTITQLGLTDGLVYDDGKIQASIDALASKQAEIKVAQSELERQRITNTKDTEVAQTARDIAFNNKKKEADAAQYAAAATAANLSVILKQRELDIAMKNAEARLALATNPNFKMPNVISDKTFSVMGLDQLMGDGK